MIGVLIGLVLALTFVTEANSGTIDSALFGAIGLCVLTGLAFPRTMGIALTVGISGALIGVPVALFSEGARQAGLSLLAAALCSVGTHIIALVRPASTGVPRPIWRFRRRGGSAYSTPISLSRHIELDSSTGKGAELIANVSSDGTYDWHWFYDSGVEQTLSRDIKIMETINQIELELGRAPTFPAIKRPIQSSDFDV